MIAITQLTERQAMACQYQNDGAPFTDREQNEQGKGASST
jgi:hypothetical protein